MSSGNEDIGEKYHDNTLDPARSCRPRPKSAHFQAQRPKSAHFKAQLINSSNDQPQWHSISIRRSGLAVCSNY